MQQEYDSMTIATPDAKKRPWSRMERLLAVTAGLCAVLVLTVIIAAVIVVPKVKSAAESVEALGSQLGEDFGEGKLDALIDTLSEDLDFKQLSELTDSLNEADLPQLIDDVQALVEESRSSISGAAEKLDALDIESLNKAIESLNTIVTPLAKLFNRGD